MNEKINNQDDNFETIVKAQLMRQYQNGLKTGTYTMSKIIIDKIDNFKGDDINELVTEIRRLAGVMIDKEVRSE